MNKKEIEQLEIDLLIEAIYRCHGHDFRNYARSSLNRRIRGYMQREELEHISEIIPKILYTKSFWKDLVYSISVPVSDMFRDPDVFLGIRNKIIPYLKTFPFIKIWIAGVATGEEVYSLAILLEEEILSDKFLIYATDFNDEALQKAKDGIYSIDQVEKWARNYKKSGGKKQLSDYYHTKYESIIINRKLKKNITFSNHNLATDSSFGEMQLIMCRNVLIYFDKKLQDRVLRLLFSSLADHGYLCLGNKESLQFSAVQNQFHEISKKERIFQKRLQGK